MRALRDLLAGLVALGPTGLFLAALLDGAGVPVPSGVDVLLVAVASTMPDSILELTAVTVLGSVAGNLVLFAIARRGGEIFLARRTQSKRGRRFRGWFDRYGLLTVFVSALVPLPIMPMKIFVFCAGALGVRPLQFTLAFVGARIPRYLGLALLGRAMGNDAMAYLRAHAWHLAAFAVGLFLFLMTLIKIADRRRPA
jgi:membrane protein DedA with SNARE-associated domain